ncbi:MAG TPA: hypothetical protein VGX68_25350 [Thermoanaerobaculia bacterium]|jgi:hypothetical protein|nr:hypothetical protein [Thermoanaerobaculia bacterium]
MITFLSLFFGLITGPYPVELTVNGPVAAVEMVLDGRSLGQLQGPPWKARIDFGLDLLPHKLTARALDTAGREIARAEEWVNLPHSLTKVDILLEGDKLGPPRAAKLSWTNLRGEVPRTVTLTFDGQLLPLDAAGRALLPPHDLKSVHVLSAEIASSPENLVRKDVAYGGEYGSEVSTELTGVPVRVRKGSLPPAEKLGGWLTAAGAPLAVAAVEEGPAYLYVVRAADDVRKLGSKGLGAPPRGRRQWDPPGGVWEARFSNDQQVRLLLPFTRRYESSGETTDLFDISPPFGTQGGFPTMISHLGPANAPPWLRPGKLNPERRIADAVAVAAQEAVRENRRRAVLLVVSGNEKDESLYDAAMVRRFLAALRVPLFVWCLEEPAPGSPLAAWGTCENVTAAPGIVNGMDRIRKELDAQRIILVDGRHLPQSIALSSAAIGVELVGERTP